MGPAIDTIATLAGPFDLVFIDADKAGLPRLLRSGPAQAGAPGPDRRRQHAVERPDPRSGATPAEDTVALRRFNDALAVDPRVVVVQTTVRDGVTLIRRAG